LQGSVEGIRIRNLKYIPDINVKILFIIQNHMKATAIANANMALSKYWGKRSTDPILPQNGSISMTLDGAETTTTVEFSENYKEHQVIINDEEFKKDEKDLPGHLERIMKRAGVEGVHAKVVSNSTIPIAAGLASSAAGFSAVTYAAAEALDLKLSEKELSIMTRMGSGSACRSIAGGFVEWYRGELDDGSDSFAESIVDENYWPEFRIIATIISEKKKAVSSRAGMAQTVETCPFYDAWLEDIKNDLDAIREGIKERNFTKVGEVAEFNAVKMHSTMMTTKPGIFYWIAETMSIIHEIRQMREEGVDVYFTMDAGPNVAVMCLERDVVSVNRRLQSLDGVIKTIISKPGKGAYITDTHLF
jgi:diphosphomevalonate decarboxylase